MPCLVFIGTLLANPALADDGPTVAVVGMHQAGLDARQQERVSADLVDALDGTGVVTPLDPSGFARAIAGREGIILEEALLAQGREYLAAGRLSFNNAFADEAKANLEAAVDALTAGIAGANTTRDLWEAWVYLGATQFNLGDDAAGTASFEVAIALDPDRKLDEAYWAPNLVQAYADASARLEAMSATLEIKGAKGTVWLDGAEVGDAPVTIDGVRPGTHHVVVRGDGLQAYHQVVVPAEEGGADKVTVDADLAPPTLGTSGGSASARAGQTARLYQAIGKHTQGVDLVLMAGSDDADLMLQLYDVRSESFSKPLTIPVGGDAASQAVDNVGTLINRLDGAGALPEAQRDPKAVALPTGDNELLAQMLTQPSTAVAIAPIDPGGGNKGGKGGTIAAIVGASVGVAALTAGGILIGTGALGGGEDTPVYDGTIVIGPF